MAADDNQVDVKIKLSADNKGGEAAVQTIDKIEKSAKSAADSTSNSFKKAEQSVSRFGKILHSITQISFVTGSISSVISLWDSLREKASKAKEEAEAFAKEQAKAADKKKIDELAESYRKLGEQIGEAAKERQRANELEDMQTAESDKLEDAEAKLKKTRAIAALDPSDPAYEEKKRQIEAEYESTSASREVSRAKRDAETKERREYAEAEAKHGEATEYEFAAIEDRSRAAAMRGRAESARARSEEDNEKDASGFWSNFFGQLKAIVTLDTKHLGTHRTEAGDEERKRLAEEAKRYDEQAKELEKSAEEKKKAAKEADAEATHHSNLAGIYGMSAANTSVAQENAALSGKAAADQAAAQVARREKELADAKALLASGESTAAGYRARINDNNEKISQTQFGMATGQVNSTSGGRIVSELQEQNKSLENLLAEILKQIDQSKRIVEKANERTRNSRGVDSTEGK